jgi:hypothetical protein
MNTEKTCAYCGKKSKSLEREHVIPKCLYPPSKSCSKIQRLTILACKKCNNSWSDDEAHFRNVLTVSGDPPTPEKTELLSTTIKRSLSMKDGPKRAQELLSKMKPVFINDKLRYKIYPGNDSRVIRIIKKIIKGLCYHHYGLFPISDEKIFTDVLKIELPDNFYDNMKYDHRDRDIIEYWYEYINDSDIHSGWLLKFYKKVIFYGVVLKP